MARATGEDPAAGLPDEWVPRRDPELGLFDPSPQALPTEERNRAGAARRRRRRSSPGIVNSRASWGQGEAPSSCANTMGFWAATARRRCLSPSHAGERGGQMERDYWYTGRGAGLADLEAPEEVGERPPSGPLRRWGRARCRRATSPSSSIPNRRRDPGHAVLRDHGLRRLPGRHVPEGPPRRGGGPLPSSLSSDDGAARPRPWPRGPSTARGCHRRNVPRSRGGCWRHCSATRTRPQDPGRRPSRVRPGAGGRGAVVGATNLFFEPGTSSPDAIGRAVARGLYATDLIGFGRERGDRRLLQGAVGPLDRRRAPRPSRSTRSRSRATSGTCSATWNAVGTTSSSAAARPRPRSASARMTVQRPRRLRPRGVRGRSALPSFRM